MFEVGGWLSQDIDIDDGKKRPRLGPPYLSPGRAGGAAHVLVVLQVFAACLQTLQHCTMENFWGPGRHSFYSTVFGGFGPISLILEVHLETNISPIYAQRKAPRACSQQNTR